MVSNKKNQNTAAPDSIQNKIIDGIARHCMHLQANSAAWMQRKTQPLSVKVKVILLLLFCSLTSAYSICLISESLLGKPALSSFKVTAIKKPGYTQLSGDEKLKAPLVINEEEYQKVHQFRLYMDSLANSSSGRRFHDSILQHRPGLRDSIEIIENIYQITK